MDLPKAALSLLLLLLLISYAESGRVPGRTLLQNAVSGRGNSTVPAIFAFGDSTTDTGENKYLSTPTTAAGLPPYGETYFMRPTGRFSNGRLVIDFVAAALGLPYFLPPYLQLNASLAYGANFASAGSGVLNETSTQGQLPLYFQLQQFLSLRNNATLQAARNITNPNIFSEALYFLSDGGNDLLAEDLYSYRPSQGRTRVQYINDMVSSVQNTLTAIYNVGGRKFLLANVPPLGCLPSARAINPLQLGGCLDEFNQFTNQYNQAVGTMVAGLRQQLVNVTIIEADVYSYLQAVINNPQQYGFTEEKSGCCGGGPYNGLVDCATGRFALGNATLPSFITNIADLKSSTCSDPNSHVFWDQIHGTEYLYEQVSYLILTNSSYVRPTGLANAFGVVNLQVVMTTPGANATVPIPTTPNLPIIPVATNSSSQAAGTQLNSAFAPVSPTASAGGKGVRLSLLTSALVLVAVLLLVG